MSLKVFMNWNRLCTYKVKFRIFANLLPTNNLLLNGKLSMRSAAENRLVFLS